MRSIPAWPRRAFRRRPLVDHGEAAGLRASNVGGRRVVGPSQGFGQLWRKRFTVVLASPAPQPADVVSEWKREFSRFWPGDSELRVNRMEEDQVAAADLGLPAGTRIATGLVVVASEPDSFTLMTVQGHMFAGWVRFSATADDEGVRAMVEIEMRAGDPIYELGLVLGGHRQEERFWKHTLSALAAHFAKPGVPVSMEAALRDSHRNWSRARNVWYNAAIRTQAQRAWRALRTLPGWPCG